MKWRLLELAEYDAFTNMAIDEVLVNSVSSGKSPPVIRFYKWKPAAISLGYYQLATDVDLDLLKKKKMSCVRRITGGMAVFHHNADLTYSIIAPLNIFPKGLSKSYKEICSWILHALKEVGINAEIDGNDIRVDGKKISGNAQNRLNDVLLQHGTLVYELNVALTQQVLKLKDKKIVEDEVTSVLEHKEISFNEVYEKVKESFMKNKEIEISELTEEEKELLNKLLKEKYKTNEWNLEGEGKEKGPCYIKM